MRTLIKQMGEKLMAKGGLYRVAAMTALVFAISLPQGAQAVTVANPGFESPVMDAGGYTYASGEQTYGNWTFSGDGGIARNGAPWYGSAAPEGLQAGWFRYVGKRISQSITFPAEGNYKVSFSAVGRTSGCYPMDVQIDGVTVYSIAAASISTTAWGTFTSPAFLVTAGAHTLSFVIASGSSIGSDPANNIDNVTVSDVPFVGSSSSSAYTVSSTDLLQTAVSSTNNALSVNTAENNTYSHGTFASLTDGAFGDANANGGLCIGGGSATYYLNTSVNTNGYDISTINTYSGWANTGRANQNYTVSFRTVGSGTFGNAKTITYAATDKLTWVTIPYLNLTGVDAIKFDFSTPAQQNGGVGYKELDVIGIPTPMVPAAPAGLAATSLPSSIILNWASVSGATGYMVKRSTTSGSGYGTVGTSSVTNFTDSTVIQGTSYWYVVSATNSRGESANSSEINTQTSVIKADQTITFTLGVAITNALFAAPFADVATASSTLAVTYTSDNTAVATVAVDGTVTIVGIGVAHILANQAGDANFNPALQASQTLTVTKAMPVITWGTPASIKDGTALSAAQLNATSGGVAGNFVYTPPSGTVLGVGVDQTLSVQFTPNDSASYFTPAAKEVLITVIPLSTACDISAFSFGALGNPVISGTNITLYVPFGTAVTALAPTYSVSPFASGSPASGTTKDFTAPQTYTVTAEDGMTTKAYVVSVMIMPWTGTSSASAYTVSGTDLLQTQLGSATNALSVNTVENNTWSHGTLTTLTDGSFGAAGANGGLCIAGGSVTYYLNTTANRYGYDISAIDTYSGWEDTDRTSQKYTVSFRKSGSGTFGDAITVSYMATKKLTHVSIAGLRLIGVDAVRFDFDTPATNPQQQSGGVAYKELDVIGQPSPPKCTLISIY